MGLLILSYREPRLLRAHGSCSALTIAFQGNLAGCGHAVTCMALMTYRAVLRASALNSYMRPRLLVDDCSLQWIARAGASIEDFHRVVRMLFSDLRELRLVLQASKSGFIATAQKLVKLYTPLAKKGGDWVQEGDQESRP